MTVYYDPLSKGTYYNMYSGNDCAAWVRARRAAIGCTYTGNGGYTMAPVDGTEPTAGAVGKWGYDKSSGDGHIAFVEYMDGSTPVFSTAGGIGYGKVWVTDDFAEIPYSSSWKFKGYWYTDALPNGSPEPGPTPQPAPDQPIDPLYGPGGTIWLKSFKMVAHYTIYNDSSGLYWHPGMDLYINDEKVAHGNKGYYRSDTDKTYTDIEWNCNGTLVKTDNIYVRLSEDHESCTNFAILGGTFSTMEYYTFSDSDIGGTKHIRTYDGTKWTDWTPGLSSE